MCLGKVKRELNSALAWAKLWDLGTMPTSFSIFIPYSEIALPVDTCGNLVVETS
jgi:hypothetical protein